MADDEIMVTIAPALDQNATVTTEKTEAVENKTDQDAVADLKSQYETLQAETAREREVAQRREREATERAAVAERVAGEALGRAAESEFDTVVNGIAAATAEAEAAEREYTAAYDVGDGKAMAAAQRKMARAEARASSLEDTKTAIEARAKLEPTRREERRAPPPSDPVEAYIANRTAPTQRWLRAHTEFVADANKQAKLSAAHYDAVGDGLAPDTDAYFEHVEKFLGLRKTEIAKPNGAARKAPVVAPVGAPSGGGMNGGAMTVTLTAGEAKSATDGTIVWNYPDPTGKNRWKKGDPIGHQEMARRKSEMKKQGLYDRAYVEQ